MNRLATIAIFALASTQAVTIGDQDGGNYARITGRVDDSESLSSLGTGDMYSMAEQREQHREVAAAFREVLASKRSAAEAKKRAELAQASTEGEDSVKLSQAMREAEAGAMPAAASSRPRGTFEIKPQPAIETTTFG